MFSSIREIYDAFGRGDIAAVLNHVDPQGDLVLDIERLDELKKVELKMVGS